MRSGITLIEMLVAVAILGIIFAFVGAFLAQQTRVTALSQSMNAVELSSRTVAETVAQDLQMAGGRAVVVGGSVDYDDIRPGCSESNRSACIELTDVNDEGVISTAAVVLDANGVAIFYRTSLVPAEPCRRIDYFVLDDMLYRSDVSCTIGAGSTITVDVDDVAFASGVDEFGVTFECTNSQQREVPSDCYASGNAELFVRQAFVDVTIRSAGREVMRGSMRMEAFTPNMRPSVNYGRTVED